MEFHIALTSGYEYEKCLFLSDLFGRACVHLLCCLESWKIRGGAYLQDLEYVVDLVKKLDRRYF